MIRAGTDYHGFEDDDLPPVEELVAEVQYAATALDRQATLARLQDVCVVSRIAWAELFRRTNLAGGCQRDLLAAFVKSLKLAIRHAAGIEAQSVTDRDVIESSCRTMRFRLGMATAMGKSGSRAAIRFMREARRAGQIR